MTIPRVILIGGAPFVGKSATARCIAARYEYGCISTDDIAKAVGSVTNALTGPMNSMDWRDYFTRTSVDLLLNHDKKSRERLWPAIDKIVRTHATWGDPLLLEGYALWPEQVMTAGFTATGAVWLTCDDLLLESRIRACPAFYQGAEDEKALIMNFLRRSCRFNKLIIQSAVECRATVITVEISHSANDVADLCMSALAKE